ncbi:MAG: hypothetical protein E7647_05695 [Ruminococcaceae bacterium]|nr:hypothetical protein [Oscillospiraceae bacterium]
MKKAIISFALVAALIASATCVSAAVLSPGLDVIAADMDVTVSALRGESVTFSAEQFSEAVGADSYEKLKITSLPEESAGLLYFGDVLAKEGQVIESASVSSLRFEPCENAEGASFGFTFDGAYSMTCNVVYTDKRNSAPTVLKSPALTAFTKTATSGEMRAHDGDGDSLFYEVIKYPEGGKIKFDSKTGEFTYTAGSRVMEDSFTYRVKDSVGNLSEIGECTVNITENTSGTVFSDMDDSTTVVSAVAMTDNGYMTAVEDKGKTYFSPDSEVSRLDFLVTAMNVFGAGNIPKVESTGFADDASIPEQYKGYVYSASKLGIISEASAFADFRPADTVTKAEASVILNRIIGYEAKTVSTLAGVPHWAEDSVCAMYELGIYDLSDGAAMAGDALRKDEAADMLYKVCCLLGE